MGDRQLRVAVMTRSVYPVHGVGGLERHVFDLVRHHLATGIDVTLVTRPPATRPLDGREREAWAALTNRQEGFRVVHVPYTTFPLAGRRGTTVIDRSTAYPLFGRRAGGVVARLAREGRIDVAYGLGASALGFARARRRGTTGGVPFVFNPQGLEEFGGADGRYGGTRLKGLAYAPLRTAVRACAAAADAVIATDRSLEPVVRRHLAIDGDRLRLVPNGIDLDTCDGLAGPAAGRGVRSRAGIGAEEVVLFSAGRLEFSKGFQDLVAALATWDPGVAWRWVLAGDGPHRAEIERAVARANIRRRATLLGRIDDSTLHAWYEGADLFVHPTRYEGSSLVTLEAMAHRRPVLATRAGGLPDKVLDANGWLVAPGEPAALAAGLQAAFARRGEWRAMGEQSRALVERTFDWRVIQRAFQALYDELLSGATPARAY